MFCYLDYITLYRNQHDLCDAKSHEHNMKNKAEIQTFLAFFCQFLLSFTINHITHAESSTHAVSFELITSSSPRPVETKLTLVPSSELPTPPHSDHDSGPPPQGASRLTLLLRPFVYQFPHHDVQTIPPPPSCVTFGGGGGGSVAPSGSAVVLICI